MYRLRCVCKRSPFMLQKALSCTVKGRLSQCKRRPFKNRYDKTAHIMDYKGEADIRPALSSGISVHQLAYVFLNGLVSHVFQLFLINSLDDDKIQHGEQHSGKHT